MMTNLYKYLLKIPLRILDKINRQYFKMNYNQAKYQNLQNNIFKNNNLNRDTAKKKLDEIKRLNNISDMPMSSEHEIIFSAISEKQSPQNILEIGTYDGFNSLLLSKLFPNSEITTIDLPDDDELFINFYGRSNKIARENFIKIRNKNLSSTKRIIFKQCNSIELYKYDRNKFDIIWVDGAHGYPFVTIDIINSIKILNKNGYLLCDDIWMQKPIYEDSMYHSIASYETLKVLEKSLIIKNNFFYKRLDKENNSYTKTRKFISMSQLL